MKTRPTPYWAFLATLLALLIASRPLPARAYASAVLQDYAAQATGDDPAASAAAIARLRDAGPEGLAALLESNADAIARHRAQNAGSDDADWPRICAAIDAVAAQKDAWASGLYWYTDFDEARRQAQESHKPILSLRLLGTLDTEFSCANSRFFRTVLYANAEVSKVLADRFILHWKSVRPVPKVTIDFGDGRVLERTITGNSIHYVLDADGRVIDAIPGLYGPTVFLQKLHEAAAHAGDASTPAGATALAQWHAKQGERILRQWQADLQNEGFSAIPSPVLAADASYKPGFSVLQNPADSPLTSYEAAPISKPPSAGLAARTTASKLVVEGPMVGSLTVGIAPRPTLPRVTTETPMNPSIGLKEFGQQNAPPIESTPLSLQLGMNSPLSLNMTATTSFLAAPRVFGNGLAAATPDAQLLEAICTDATWSRIAALHADESRLDARSKAVMATKNPRALAASRIGASGGGAVPALAPLIQNFERAVAEDSVRNEYLFHRQIHAWLAAGTLPDGKPAADVGSLNERIYADLFLTPSSDPWLGLLPPDTYSALLDDGVCQKK